MPNSPEGNQYLAQRQRMAADVIRLLEAAKANITAGTEDADAQANLDAAIARLKTTQR